MVTEGLCDRRIQIICKQSKLNDKIFYNLNILMPNGFAFKNSTLSYNVVNKLWKRKHYYAKVLKLKIKTANSRLQIFEVQGNFGRKMFEILR